MSCLLAAIVVFFILGFALGFSWYTVWAAVYLIGRLFGVDLEWQTVTAVWLILIVLYFVFVDKKK